LLVREAKVRTDEHRVRECGHRGRRQLRGLGVSVRVIRVPVRVDHVRDAQPLIAGALDEPFGRVRRVDQHAPPGVAVAEQVAEVPVAASTDLFEDELHVRVLPPMQSTAALRPLAADWNSHAEADHCALAAKRDEKQARPDLQLDPDRTPVKGKCANSSV
jgi:hypothetical protein